MSFYFVSRIIPLLILILTAFQAASAEHFLYIFNKGSQDGLTAVEAVQEEKLAGFLKLTTPDGKTVAWQENMLAGKFRLFEAADTPDVATQEAYVAELTQFIAKEPRSSVFLQPLADKWKVQVTQTKIQVEDNTRKVAEEKLAQFLAEEYRADSTYSLETLAEKLKQQTELAAFLPEQATKINDYIKPWAEELQNRQAGLVRFEGRWLSPDAITQLKAERVQAARQNFLEKELVFQITEEALSQKTILIVFVALGVSALIFGGMFLGGVKGLFSKPGLMTWISLLISGGGLAAYGIGAWLLLQATAIPEEKAAAPAGIAQLDDLIFSIHQPPGAEAPAAPAQILIDDHALNSFLEKYLIVKLNPAPKGYSLVRKKLKVQLQEDRILVFDEMKLGERDITVCYTLYFSQSDAGLQFGETAATIGNLPMPGRLFSHLWSQVSPVMGTILNQSMVLETYRIKNMKAGQVEMASIQSLPKQQFVGK